MPTVLVVDDHPAVRHFVAGLLRGEGVDVVMTTDWRVALERVRAHPPDVIVLDCFMPRCDGPAFAAAYRQTPGLLAPIVLLTAAPAAPRRAGEVRAAAHLTKPLHVVDLTTLVGRYARR